MIERRNSFTENQKLITIDVVDFAHLTNTRDMNTITIRGQKEGRCSFYKKCVSARFKPKSLVKQLFALTNHYAITHLLHKPVNKPFSITF